MPHQCVKCGRIFEDASSELLKGCNDCGGKFFFFIRKERLEQAKEVVKNLSLEQKEIIEKDAMEFVGNVNNDMPVILDLASIDMSEPGKFDLDIVKLFKKDPLVYKLEEGKYIIDVAETFKREKDLKNRKR